MITMKNMRDILRWVFFGGGILILGITYKTDAIPPAGYLLGIALVLSIFWGKDIGQIMIGIGVLLAGITFLSPRFLSRYMDIETNGYLLGIIWGTLGGFLYWIGVGGTKYFCSACDQYLGYSYKQCPRCGSNRYRTVSED